MNKKDYLKPQMKVVKIQHSKMLCGSARSVQRLAVPNEEGFTMPESGIIEDGYDDV